MRGYTTFMARVLGQDNPPGVLPEPATTAAGGVLAPELVALRTGAPSLAGHFVEAPEPAPTVVATGPKPRRKAASTQ